MAATFTPPIPAAERWRDLAKLVRLPNVFTALADIAVGALTLAVWGAWPAWGGLAFACLFLASASLYSAGMVWNDFFDVEQDRRERPNRPVASGRVSRASAGWLGLTLLLVGLAAACAAGLLVDRWTPAIVAALLVCAILLYDAWLKRTWAGPLGMGLCRFLNVLLGFSLVDTGWGLMSAWAVGTYIVGVTWFARTEARTSQRASLVGAAAVMLAGLALALPVPVTRPDQAVVAVQPALLFPYLLVVLGFLVGLPVRRAIARPTPAHVQAAVKRSIMGLVLLDALLASALAGNIGLAIVVLLLPALYLGRWIYST